MRHEIRPAGDGDEAAAAARRVLQKILFDGDVSAAPKVTSEDSTPVFHGPLAQAAQRLTDEGYPPIDSFVLMQAMADVLTRAGDWTTAEINESTETYGVSPLPTDVGE